MKNYITDISFTDVDYCRYGLPNKKRTRIWNNFGFKGKLCNKECGYVVNGRHTSNFDDAKNKINNFTNTTLRERYRIPEELINNWTNYFSV